MEVVETLQIRPTMLLIYDTYIDRPTAGRVPKLQSFDRFANIGKKAYSGELSPHSRKRMTKALNLLVALAKKKRVQNPKTNKWFTFKVNFVTLTLPSAQRSVSDRDLKTKVFDPFIKSMKRKHSLKSYVWRAERQFNGNLHFHLTTETFLPLHSIRDEWNRFLSKYHFIDEFKLNHGHINPNSTDVHSVHKINNIGAYMVKYMSKNPKEHLAEINAKRLQVGKYPIAPELHRFRLLSGQPRWDDPILGKVWDCSVNLKSKLTCVIHSDSVTRSEIREIIKSPKTTYCQTDHCFIISLVYGSMQDVLPDRLRHIYNSYLDEIRNYVPPVPVPVEPALRKPLSRPINKYRQLSLNLRHRYFTSRDQAITKAITT